MKNGIVFLIAALILTGTLYAATSKVNPRKKGNPEMKKELKAYKTANVTPVLMEAHDKMDASFSKSDLSTIQSLRTENKALSEKHRAFRKSIKEEMKNTDDRQAIKSKYAQQFEAQRSEKQALTAKLKPILERNETMIKGIMDELKPQREIWKTETRAIMAKYMTAEELEQCKGGKGKRGGKGSCEGKSKGNTQGKSLEGRNMERPEGGSKASHGKGHRGGHGKIAKFVLWDGEAKSKDGEMFDLDRSNRLGDRPTMGQNYPNPASSSTTIDFDLPKDISNLQVLVTDMQGKVVRRYNFENRTAGAQSLDLNLRGLPSGTYLYTLEGEGFKETRKMSVAQ